MGHSDPKKEPERVPGRSQCRLLLLVSVGYPLTACSGGTFSIQVHGAWYTCLVSVTINIYKLLHMVFGDKDLLPVHQSSRSRHVIVSSAHVRHPAAESLSETLFETDEIL